MKKGNENNIQKAETNKDVAVKKKKSFFKEFLDFLIPIVIAIIIAIVLKSVVFANAVVPTGSMLNTIQLKDRVIASRLAYKNDEPQRNDIILFYYPDDPKRKTVYVKRVIGLPGETVEMVNGVVYITKTDGEIVQLKEDFVTVEEPLGDYGPYVVPENSYFMLGDNRNKSKDSRFWQNQFVNKEDIIGKVLFKYYPKYEKIQ